jgi:ATP-dependent exoDNAse (exonuclease V) beta subunit
VHGGAGLAERQEIWDLAHLLRFLVEPSDDHALLGLLRTPWMGWSDELLHLVTALTCGLGARQAPPLWDRVCRVTRRTVDGLSLSDAQWAQMESARRLLRRALARCHHATPIEVVEEIFTETGAWGLVRMERDGRRRLANLRRGLEGVRAQGAARGFESVEAAAESLRRFVERGDREGEEQLAGLGEDAVSLMTVHGAKGLEYPIVILAELDHESQVQEKSGNVLWNPKIGLGVRAPDPTADMKPEKSALMKLALVHEEREQRAEEARLLYVAMTRAKRLLIAAGAVRGALSNATEAHTCESKLGWIFDAVGVSAGDLAGESLAPRWPHAEPIPLLSPERLGAMASPRDQKTSPMITFQVAESTLAAIERLPARPDAERAVSISALADFALCPNVHFLGRESGSPRRDWFKSMDADSTKPDAAKVGSLLHRLVEKHRVDSNGLAATIEEYWRTCGEPEDHAVTARTRDLWNSLERMPIWDSLRTASEARAEFPVLVPHSEGPLRGRIDLLARLGDAWEIIDFKTTARIANEQSAETRHRIQMLCYLLHLRAWAPEQPEWNARLVFPALKDVKTITLKPSEVEDVITEIGDLIRHFKLERGRLHRVFPNPACPGCAFERLPICRRLGAVSARETPARRSA